MRETRINIADFVDSFPHEPDYRSKIGMLPAWIAMKFVLIAQRDELSI
jgi:hypothetical protein